MSPNVSAFVCAMCDVDQVPSTSHPPGTASTTSIDMRDAPTVFGSATDSSDGNLNDATNGHDIPTFGIVQLKFGFVRLYQLVTSLVIQIAVIASVVISLKDRITAVEGTRTRASVHVQETETLRRQVSELCRRVASQEDRITSLEVLQRADKDSYEKAIQELTTKVDNTKVDDDRKALDGALESLRQSLKLAQYSIECQSARTSGVKADTSRKIALLQTGLASVQTELAMVKMVALPVNAASASQAAKEARRERILASVAQRMEDGEMAKGSEFSNLVHLRRG